VTLVESSQVSPVRPSAEVNMKVKILRRLERVA
jgi:hypothetical protein